MINAKFIFGNPEHKNWTLSLYNAINGTNYQNPDDIEFNTIEDALYLGMKNDVSFIRECTINCVKGKRDRRQNYGTNSGTGTQEN